MIGKLRAVVADACILAMSNAEEEDRHGKLTKCKKGRRWPWECVRAGGVDSRRAERSTPGFYGAKHVAGHMIQIAM